MDNHAKNNVAWTESHINMFIRNNISNLNRLLIDFNQEEYNEFLEQLVELKNIKKIYSNKHEKNCN